MNNLKDICLNYFYWFSRKNIEGLAPLFASTVELFDWEISAVGRDEVLAANEKIFNSVNTITVTPRNMYQQDNVVVAEILITVDGSEQFHVVDVITFEDNLIKGIRAYKGWNANRKG
jgi:hypothetical protein